MTTIAASTASISAAVARGLRDWRNARRKVLRHHAGRNAVHEWRICCRRLAAMEQVLAPAVTGPRGGAMRARLHDAFHATGRLRDTQLVVSRLRQLAVRFPAAARPARRLHRGLARQRARVTRKVRAVRPRLVRGTVAAWHVFEAGPRRLARRGARREARLQSRLRRAAAGWRSVRGLHRYRMDTKLLRYMQEFCRDAGLPCGMRRVRQLAGLQRRLGRITDLQVLLRTVDAFAAKHPGWRRRSAPLRRHLLHRRQELLRSLR